ncbi:hypothetical protein WSM22_30060 [Cytophagales bacterium WSM2-2]|nr:hypothetical protein WSM22_30060 [Cytophagales bacterium WSM2-2]
MGELRTSHFHAGLDIRTNNTIGFPVRATQRGYVSYIIVSPHGYGNCLFLTHPDGNMSVYAHLDKFKGKVADYVLNKQYEKKSFALILEPTPDQFLINQGDTIALSGNTGASEGPHLHFEIRDSNNEAINPLQFKFAEIKDGMAPTVTKIALKTLDINSRINGKFGRVEFFTLSNGNNYFLPMPVQAQGKIGIEILAHDRMDQSQFRCGINHIEMSVDSQKVFSQKINSINFFDTYDIVKLVNFEVLKTRGVRFNKLYIEDGNPLKYYEKELGHGEITVTDKPVNAQIDLRDTYGNESHALVKLIPAKPSKEGGLAAMTKPFEYEISENVFSLHVQACAPMSKAVIYEKGSAVSLEPAFESNGQQVYLIDLKKMIPDSAQTCRGTIRFDIVDRIPSTIEYTFYSDWADIKFHSRSLYDTLFLNLRKSIKDNTEIYTIGRDTEPLNDPIEVTLKQMKKGINDPKTFVYLWNGRSNEFIGGQWENGNISFSTSKLGDFVLRRDSIPPAIYRISCNSSTARFRISDNLSGIAKYEAKVDGEWLLMKYDAKYGILQSEFFDKTKSIKGEFELKITDRAGNENIYKQKI